MAHGYIRPMVCPGTRTISTSTSRFSKKINISRSIARLFAVAVSRVGTAAYIILKIPDLIGVKDRKYIDHTATHLHRGIGDLMRYAALVSFAETVDFGRYRMIDKSTKRIQMRIPDEALYALALYIYSLEPPPNPNPF